MFNSPPQGWQCPVCKTVYAPTVSECKCAANARVRDGDTTGITFIGAVLNSAPASFEYATVDLSPILEIVPPHDYETPIGAQWEQVGDGQYRLRIRYKQESK